MKKKRALWFVVIIVQLLLVVVQCSTIRWNPGNNGTDMNSSPPVQLHRHHQHVVLENGFARIYLSTQGMITGIEYNGIDNLLEYRRKPSQRGYWDIVWSDSKTTNTQDLMRATNFSVISEDENKIELSFTRTWDPSLANDGGPPLDIDRRFIMLRGSPGFYTYSIFERSEGMPAVNIVQARIAFKLQGKLFYYMAISDDKQRVMPSAEDRSDFSSKALAYQEARLLTNPANPSFKGEVDDKYQYSEDNKDNSVHGWISDRNRVGFWLITPSSEFRCGGPVKQELTSHVGPTALASFCSGHYAGTELSLKFEDGEAWKKVYGPVFIYLNSASSNDDLHSILWADAKAQMLVEKQRWPYNFPVSDDYPHADQRGTVRGKILVRDRYISQGLLNAESAYVGLASPGDAGSWQRDAKGYQFWNQTDAEGNFFLKGVRPGNYSLYAWVPGFIGDYRYNVTVTIPPGNEIKVGDLIYEPPRNGPTLWEIGIPDRTAAEFYVPDPRETLVNHLYVNHTEKFRQYGLWERYTDLYPDEDLVYTVGVSNYRTDWFYAQVTRNMGNGTYEPTTWQISFDLPHVIPGGTYTLRVAVASATAAQIRVYINRGPSEAYPISRIGFIGRDNAIARHGIHGLYWVYSFDVPADNLRAGTNTIFLNQHLGSSPFIGLMYDYIRLEGPPTM